MKRKKCTSFAEMRFDGFNTSILDNKLIDIGDAFGSNRWNGIGDKGGNVIL